MMLLILVHMVEKTKTYTKVPNTASYNSYKLYKINGVATTPLVRCAAKQPGYIGVKDRLMIKAMKCGRTNVLSINLFQSYLD